MLESMLHVKISMCCVLVRSLMPSSRGTDEDISHSRTSIEMAHTHTHTHWLAWLAWLSNLPGRTV